MKATCLAACLILSLNAATWSRADYGTRYLAETAAPLRLDKAGQKIAYRFTCQRGGLLSQVSVYCAAARAPLLTRLTLAEDREGKPGETVLRRAEFVPQGGAWTSLALDGVTLAQGRVYHLVLESDLLRGDGENLVKPRGPEHVVEADLKDRWADFAATAPLNRGIPFGDPDPAAQTLFFDGDRWSDKDLQPVYVLRVGHGQVDGNPCARPLSLPLWAGGPQQAQVLHFTCEFVPDSMEVRVRKRGAPDKPLTWRLLEYKYLEGKYEEFARGEIPASGVGREWSWVKVPVDTAGHHVYVECFYAAFATAAGGPGRPQDGACRDCYELEGMEVPAGLQEPATATFDGGAHRSRASTSDDGVHWTDRFEADLNVVVNGVDCPGRRQPDAEGPLVPLPPPFSGVWQWGGKP